EAAELLEEANVEAVDVESEAATGIRALRHLAFLLSQLKRIPARHGERRRPQRNESPTERAPGPTFLVVTEDPLTVFRAYLS
ncbi:MAG TPA: hypothetical protein VK427_22145, partial [Kofleriaceae bacterium]|nr:hypothetical protein [Kofleriaceae bacterium]